MDILIGGISKYLLKTKIRPLFEEAGYSGAKYHQANKIKHSKEIVDELSKLDLMILSGSEDGSYGDFYKLTVDNSEIPSILLIANVHQGVMNVYANIHPPSYTCYFSEFEGITKEKMDMILSGKGLDWSLY